MTNDEQNQLKINQKRALEIVQWHFINEWKWCILILTAEYFDYPLN